MDLTVDSDSESIKFKNNVINPNNNKFNVSPIIIKNNKVYRSTSNMYTERFD